MQFSKPNVILLNAIISQIQDTGFEGKLERKPLLKLILGSAVKRKILRFQCSYY